MTDQKNDGLAYDTDLLTTKDFQTLAQSARELTKELSLEKLLNNILEIAGRLTDSPEASVILRNERQHTLYFAAATGDEADWILSSFGIHSDNQIPIDGSKAGEVYKSGVSLVENFVKDHFGEVDDETKTTTKSMVCVPLAVGEKRLGVMQVLNKTSGDYSDRDRIILEYFSDQASVAIRNARLMESLLAHSGLYGSSRQTDKLLARMDELEQEAHAETLSVLFADMRGFTQLCQSLLNPVLVQGRLSEFITTLSQAVVDHDGIVNKFLGDGLMALFQGTDYSTRAVKCAFSMVHEFELLKERWNDESNQQLEFLDLGVGIVTDQVILGGIGSREMRDYTAIGTAVNLSAAFENEARNGKHILCDQLTYRNAKDVIAQADDPIDFELRKPGQEVGVKYKCYNLRVLGADQQVAVFISHSHKDKDYVEARLVGPLKDRGIRTWYSAADIPKGALWTAEIRKAMSESNWMVVIVSKNSTRSKWVRREVDLGIASGHLDDRIIPVVIDNTKPSDVNDFLAAIQAIDLSVTDDICTILAERFS
jgi:class 3 adenylate cyclase/putative methionine-R-sulfoxide reductase with GAF domain